MVCWLKEVNRPGAATLVILCLVPWQEEMSGESVVSSAVPAAETRITSFKGMSPSSKYRKLNVGRALYCTPMQTLTQQDHAESHVQQGHGGAHPQPRLDPH